MNNKIIVKSKKNSKKVVKEFTFEMFDILKVQPGKLPGQYYHYHYLDSKNVLRSVSVGEKQLNCFLDFDIFLEHLSNGPPPNEIWKFVGNINTFVAEKYPEYLL